MLPWNYGFQWNAGTLIFLGAFYAVLAVVAATVIRAALWSRRELAAHHGESIRWQSDFHDLPASDRACRHVLTGEFKHRECPHAFDCRECATHANLIRRHPLAGGTDSPTEREEEIFGMSFPLDRYYHRGHAWARPEKDGTVTVGLDELGRRLLGKPDAVRLPARGTRIQANGTAFHARKRGADIAVLAPLDGEVVETGSSEGGWFLKVKPAASGEPAFRHLLRGSEIRPWLLREMERLQMVLTSGTEGHSAAPTLADGGVPVDDIAASYPEADWDAVCGEMFLRP
jgi:glycine cleavage system H lipoate-binding protein